MSKILFISSDNTGYGHKSITESLREQIVQLAPHIKIEIIDGFSLGGGILCTMSKLYNLVVVNMPLFWKLCYKFGNTAPWMLKFFSVLCIKKKLLKCIKNVLPDLIVSIHPAFVGSVLDILQDENLSIPVIPVIADLDNVSNLWADKRAKYILCPTMEAMNSMLRLGIDSDKLKILGFPVREKFCDFTPVTPTYSDIFKEKMVSILLMNGSEGTRKVSKIAKVLLKNLNCRLTIIAGNNRALKGSLEKSFWPCYENRVKICGFTEDIADYMMQSDFLIIRASPNVLIESVNLCKPVIVTGALTGQEGKNPEFVVKYNLGILCEDIQKLTGIIKQLLSESGIGLKEIYDSQIRFRKPNAAREIAELLIKVTEQTL